MKNEHAGSSFDDFLEEEEILAEVEAAAVKNIISYRIQQEMNKQHVSKKALAEKMHTSRSSVYRLLDPSNPSVNLATLQSVAHALGKKLQFDLI